jgi:ABC-type transport system involved in cytochrome bd biosynthesis fused ATPase/permease subunit
MNKNLRRKVLEDIFLHPLVIFPFVAGAITFIVSFEEGSRSIRFFGLTALTICCVTLITKLTIRFDAIVNKTYANLQRNAEKDRDVALNQFENDVKGLAEWKLLQQLRDVYKLLVSAIATNRIGQYNFLDTADRLFKASIYDLEQSFTVYKNVSGKVLPVELERKAWGERERLLEQVSNSISVLSNALEEVHRIKSRSTDLSSICAEMQEKMAIAKKSEQDNSELDKLRFKPFRYEESRI